MKKIKQFIIFLCMLGCLLVLNAGCRIKENGIEWSVTRKVMVKQNTFSNTGQSSAYFNQRIYYVSQEDGKNGIYSMNNDGSDIKFEFEVPKITRLIITSDAYYYVGVKEIREQNEHIFGFYKIDIKNLKREEVIYSEYHDPEEVTVVDAYVSENGDIGVLNIYGLTGSAPPQDGAFFVSLKNKADSFKSIDVMGKFALEIANEMIIANRYYQSGMYRKNQIGDYSCTFINAVNGEYIMDNSRLEDDTYFKVLYADDNRIFCSLNNQLILIDRKNYSIKDKIMIKNTSEEMKIANIFVYGNIVYAILKESESDVEKLYTINTETSETNELMNFNRNKIFIGIQDDKLYIAEDNYIKCYVLNGQKAGEVLYEINMQENIVDDNIFEMAADWLFIHKITLKTGLDTNKLLYKVNIKTKEVVKL